MKIALGADHRGYRYKEHIKQYLASRDIQIVDFGTNSEESVDYPDFGSKVAHAVADGEVDLGINICGSGNGMLMVANKVNGVRAGIALNPDMARLTRQHNNANVLSIAADFTPEDQLEPIVQAFLDAQFEGGRHAARVAKIGT
ncbi:MAG: ribose 5-phosphate isomerase B [candidate division Zixibacteria bacterium]|nr:ribose 5-phosphate isomerase B [candidate division Zixibacteria bacterium]